MATLQKIRNKGVLLAIIIGGALFLFIIGDFLNSGSTFFHQSKNTVGEVNGEKFKIEDFNSQVNQLSTVYKFEYGMNELNEEINSQIRKSVWQNFVNEEILYTEAAKMGLSVSKDELTDRLIGKNIHPIISRLRMFADQNGQFSYQRLMNFYNSIFNNPGGKDEDAKQQIEDYKNYWLYFERAVKNAILGEKMAILFAKTTGASNIEARYFYDSSKETGNVNYVEQSYFSVSDSSIQVTNDELKARYEKEKKLFKQEASRSINYVQFEVAPLADDFKKAEEWNKKVSEEFKTTNDVEGLVNSESDITYDGQNYSTQTVPANLKDFAFSNSTGAVFGPVFQNNTYTMAKVMQSGIMESDSVKLRHIVVASQKTADSIMTVINKGSSFADMEKKYSLDTQSSAKEGEWLSLQSVGKDFAELATSKGVGGIFQFSNQQGAYIFQVEGKSPERRKVKLAILQRKVTASDQSQTKIFNDAKQFAAAARGNSKDFEKIAKEKGYIVRPAANLDQNADQLNMIAQSRPAVKWAFTNSKGEVSDVIECGNDNYIVETVTEITPKGYQSLEKVTPMLKAEIVKDKKAELISKNMSDILAKNPSLSTLATALNLDIKAAPAINFNSNQFGEAGFEPYVIGKASVLPAGKISTPLKGNAGVFVITNDAKQVSSEPFNANITRMMLDSSGANSIFYSILQKLQDQYNVVDNRSNFY